MQIRVVISWPEVYGDFILISTHLCILIKSSQGQQHIKQKITMQFRPWLPNTNNASSPKSQNRSRMPYNRTFWWTEWVIRSMPAVDLEPSWTRLIMSLKPPECFASCVSTNKTNHATLMSPARLPRRKINMLSIFNWSILESTWSPINHRYT